MNAQVSFTLRGRNPDVLTCIANLSNDEVFTPPEFANRMLDTLADAWAAGHARNQGTARPSGFPARTDRRLRRPLRGDRLRRARRA